MKALLVAALLLSASYGANAADLRQNCRLTNAGGCVKLGNDWMEFCPAAGNERIDSVDKNDMDCVSVKPFRLAEFNSNTGEYFVVKNGPSEMDFAPVGGYTRQTFTSDCSDLSIPCAASPDTIDAVKFTVAMNTTDTAQVLIDLYVFSQDGTLTYGDSQFTVAAGSFKFDIRSDAYVFSNPNCDGVAIQVEMKTLGGLVSDHTITSESGVTSVDNVLRSPNSFVYLDAEENQQWGVASTKSRTEGASSVIAFEMVGIPNNGTFRFDPFVSVPPPASQNGADSLLASARAFVALGAVMLSVIGLAVY